MDSLIEALEKIDESIDQINELAKSKKIRTTTEYSEIRIVCLSVMSFISGLLSGLNSKTDKLKDK